MQHGHEGQEVDNAIKKFDLDDELESQAEKFLERIKEKDPESKITKEEIAKRLQKRLMRSLRQPLEKKKKLEQDEVDDLLDDVLDEEAATFGIEAPETEGDDKEAPKEDPAKKAPVPEKEVEDKKTTEPDKPKKPEKEAPEQSTKEKGFGDPENGYDEKAWRKDYVHRNEYGSALIGTPHLDGGAGRMFIEKYVLPEVDKILAEAKKNGKSVVFLAEGGSEGDNYAEGSEQELVADRVEKNGGEVDTWDGDEMSQWNPEAPFWEEVAKETGTSRGQVTGGIYAMMVGQGDSGKDALEYLDDKGWAFLKNAGYTGSIPPKTDKETKQLYEIAFPGDSDQPENNVSRVVDSFNRSRQRNLITKKNKLEKEGKVVIAVPGASHAYDLGNRFKEVPEVDSKYTKVEKGIHDALKNTLGLKGKDLDLSPGIQSALSKKIEEFAPPKIDTTGFTPQEIEAKQKDHDIEVSKKIEQMELAFGNTLKRIKELVPDAGGWSGQLIERASKAMQSGDDFLSKQGNPARAGEDLAWRIFAEQQVLNPLMVKGKPFNEQMVQQDGWAEQRAKDSFDQYNHPQMTAKNRQSTAEDLTRKLDGLDPESNEAKHHNAVLDGIALSQILNDEDITGRDVSSESFVSLAKKLNQSNNADQLLGAMHDPTSGVAQDVVVGALDDMDESELREFVGGDDGPFGELFKELDARDVFGNPKYDKNQRDGLMNLIRGMSKDNMLLNSSFISGLLGESAEYENQKRRRDETDRIVNENSRSSIDEVKADIEALDPEELERMYRKQQAERNREFAKQFKKSSKGQSFFYKTTIVNKGLCFDNLQSARNRKRSTIMARLSKKDAKTIITVMDRLANTVQKKHSELGIPEKIAEDFAYRCDLLADTLEKNAGIDNELKKQALTELDVVDETKFGPGNYNPDDINREVKGPYVQDADETYMSDNFTAQEARELRERQQGGEVGEKVILEEQKAQPGKQAALDVSLSKLSQMAEETVGKLRGLGALADDLRVAQAVFKNLPGGAGADVVKAVSTAIGKQLTAIDGVREALVKMVGAGEIMDDLKAMTLDRITTATGEILPHVKELSMTLTNADMSASPEEKLTVEDYMVANNERIKRLMTLSADIVAQAAKEFKAEEAVAE